jgi:radical SAM superfamily enzyme YgiQ (UPF0313 family)
MIKILMVYALRFIRKKAFAPPLGLLTVAAMLPTEWEKRLVDLNVTRLTQQDLAWADYVFISAMIVQREAARAVIARCKQAGVPVVAGGPLFTGEHASFPQVDYLVLNEAEITLPLFLADLERGDPQRVYATAEFPEIRQTPVPLWELADLKQYASISIQFSRGCPFDCDFCNITTLLGRRPRTKTAAQIIAELDRIYALGWRGPVFFVDDNFIGNKKQLKREVLPALIAWQQGKSGLRFSTELSINLADDEELMSMMVDAGFTTVFVGIETPDDDGLAECSKHQNRGRDLVESVRRMQRVGMQVQGGFIVGFDSDTPSIFQRQIEFIQKSGIVSAMVGLLQAFPGTQLYDRLADEGRLTSELSGDNVDGSTNIIPKMDIDVLRNGYKNILHQIYSPRLYYERITTFLREYEPPKLRVYLDPQYLLALWRSIYQLGIKGVERVHYWKLWLWTLLHKPRLFPQAIELAIYGYHFRRVCELHG